jgi:hypothetical protein
MSIGTSDWRDLGPNRDVIEEESKGVPVVRRWLVRLLIVKRIGDVQTSPLAFR